MLYTGLKTKERKVPNTMFPASNLNVNFGGSNINQLGSGHGFGGSKLGALKRGLSRLGQNSCKRCCHQGSPNFGNSGIQGHNFQPGAGLRSFLG